MIICSNILEHLYDPCGVLKTLFPYLKKDGRLIVSLRNIANWTIRLKLLFGKFEYERIGILDRSHIRFFTLRTAKRLIKDAGYRILSLDVNPNFIRWIGIVIHRILRILKRNRDKALDEEEIYRYVTGQIKNSKLYRFYLKYLRPVELWITRCWKSLFAFTFVITAEK